MTMTTTERIPTEATQDAPNENLVLHGEAYPFSDEIISLHLTYNDGTPAPDGGKFKTGEFRIRRSDAEFLAKSISVIVTAPDTGTSWDNISASIEEHDPEFSEDDGGGLEAHFSEHLSTITRQHEHINRAPASQIVKD
jgi:hypothetical protein